MSVSLIRATELYRVPDQLEDDGEYVQPCFNNSWPLPVVKWSELELGDLTTLLMFVIKYSQWWVDQRVQEIRRKKITLIYDLLSEAESYSSNVGASHNAKLVEITNSKKRKDAATNTKPIQK